MPMVQQEAIAFSHRLSANSFLPAVRAATSRPYEEVR